MEKIKVKLSESVKEYLRNYVSKGRHSARAIKRATVLLHLDSNKTIKEASVLSGVSEATVSNLKSRYKEEKGEVPKVSNRGKVKDEAASKNNPGG